MIEGGGKDAPDRHSGAARYHFEQLIVEILRALVRGQDGERRIASHLAEFTRHMTETDAGLAVVIDDAITELNGELDHQGEHNVLEQQRETIVLRALQVAAETMASDPGAKGRLGSRQRVLDAAIEHLFLRRKMGAREQQMAPKTPKQQKEALNRALENGARLMGKKRKLPKSNAPKPDDDTVA